MNNIIIIKFINYILYKKILLLIVKIFISLISYFSSEFTSVQFIVYTDNFTDFSDLELESTIRSITIRRKSNINNLQSTLTKRVL